MFKAITSWAVIAVFTAALVTVPTTASAQGQNIPATSDSLVVPVTGAIANVATVVGNLAITRFAIRNGELIAVGTLTATVTNTLTGVVRTIVAPISLPVTSATGTCEILHLVLGPLSLNLLGLQIDLNQVVLDITAVPGGGLLGDLLCAVAGLLDGGLLGQQLVSLLNQII